MKIFKKHTNTKAMSSQQNRDPKYRMGVKNIFLEAKYGHGQTII